jgi:hypothetical protein
LPDVQTEKRRRIKKVGADMGNGRNKGRQFEFWCRQAVGKALDIPENSLNLRGKSAAGCDLWPSEHVIKLFPYAVECKNRKRLNIFEVIRQAVKNTFKPLMPVIFFHRERFYLVTEPADQWFAKQRLLNKYCPDWTDKLDGEMDYVRKVMPRMSDARFDSKDDETTTST